MCSHTTNHDSFHATWLTHTHIRSLFIKCVCVFALMSIVSLFSMFNKKLRATFADNTIRSRSRYSKLITFHFVNIDYACALISKWFGDVIDWHSITYNQRMKIRFLIIITIIYLYGIWSVLKANMKKATSIGKECKKKKNLAPNKTKPCCNVCYTFCLRCTFPKIHRHKECLK